MGTKLKPCPFCGGVPFGDPQGFPDKFIECQICHARGPQIGRDVPTNAVVRREQNEKAAVGWNKRAGEINEYDIQFELVFTRGKMKDSAANGTYYRQRAKAATMKKAEKSAKEQLKARLVAEGMPTPFKLEWIGSSLIR